MVSLFYILRKSFKNGLKQLVKKKLALLGYLVLYGFMIYGAIIVYRGKSGEGINPTSLQMYQSIMLGLIILTVVPSLYSCLGKISTAFRMADVNMIFVAPYHPAKILLFSQLRQAAQSFIIMIFMVIQAPYFTGGLDSGVSGFFLYGFAWMVLTLSISPICTGLFIVNMRLPKLKRMFKTLIIALAMSLIGYVILGAFGTSDPINGMLSRASSDWFLKIPLIGWYRSIFDSVAFGFTWETLISLALILLLVTTSLIISFKFATTDFFEDAITQSEKTEEALSAIKDGNQFKNLYKNKKARKVKFQFKKAKSKVILEKQLLEMKKKGLFLFDIKSLFIISALILVGSIVPQVEEIPSVKLLAGAVLLIYFIVIIVNIGVGKTELNKHYLYLIPDNNFEKLINLTILEGIKIFKDCFIGFLVVSIIFNENIFHGFLCGIILFMFVMIQSFLELICSKLFGNTQTQMLKGFIRFIFNIIILIPGISIAIAFGLLNISLTIALLIVVLIYLSITLMLSVPAAFSIKNPEFN
ncbi:putative ABC exporter [Natranaerovirga pectinivora]|uniref:Putative ABC exporter n=1 Tax=Natranaerovirga pectinivora TaxID=682400 RepID=A0A4R3MMV1_9FIRM|nr:putative ABC exporter domain-containing protein [Natranaerovirga pectinivora]TCT13863.1 putative ABC exporter [Natranaerovirga pectinivora]